MFKSQIHTIFSSRKLKFNVIPTFLLHLFTCLWFDSLVFAQFEFDCDAKKVCRKFEVVCSFVCSSSTSPSLSIRWFNFMNLDLKEWIDLLVHIIDCSQSSNTFIGFPLRCIWHITNVERQPILMCLPITSSSLSNTFQWREKRKFWNKT
jgi:hypothetical protein